MAEVNIDNPGISVASESAAERQKPSPKKTTSKKTAPKKPSPKKAAAKGQNEKYGYYWGTGRRKSSVARVRIRLGSGKVLINKKQLDDYFARQQDRNAVIQPIKAVDAEKSFDVFVNVKGGGTTGQAGAARLGLARALVSYDENYLQLLREGSYLTRDSRMVERKKPGRRKARRSFQFSKR